MKFTKFEVENFKGIKKLELNLSKDPKLNIFTLVGLNESGKTTILEAINFFQEDPIIESKRHILIPKSKKENFNDKIYTRATLEFEDKDSELLNEFYEYASFELVKPIKSVVIEKSYKYKDSRYVSQDKQWTVNLVGKKKRSNKIKTYDNGDSLTNEFIEFVEANLIPSIIYYPNFLFDIPEKIYLEKQDNESKEQHFYRNVVQDVLDSLDSKLDLTTHILERQKRADQEEQEREALNSTLRKISAQITKKVLKTWGSLFKSQEREIIINEGYITEIKGEVPVKRYYLEIKLKEGAEEYQINERSLGFQWFFAFLLFTEFRKSRQSEQGEILFLLDEPASNLHTTAQAKLLNTFKELVSNSKLIYTTHSQYLINPDWLEGAFIVQNKALDYRDDFDFDTSKTNIVISPYKRFVAENPNQQSYFQPILDSLEHKPSNLELVPNIVLVEGKNDYYTLKYINDIYLKNKNLYFYPGNGAGKNHQVIRLYLAWGRKFLVLMDSDTAGEEARKKYLEEIGTIVEDKIFTFEDVKTEWNKISMEGLFSLKEKARIVETLGLKNNTYTKKKFNTAIQSLLYFKSKIQLTRRTLDKFVLIGKFLEPKLSK